MQHPPGLHQDHKNLHLHLLISAVLLSHAAVLPAAGATRQGMNLQGPAVKQTWGDGDHSDVE